MANKNYYKDLLDEKSPGAQQYKKMFGDEEYQKAKMYAQNKMKQDAGAKVYNVDPNSPVAKRVETFNNLSPIQKLQIDKYSPAIDNMAKNAGDSNKKNNAYYAEPKAKPTGAQGDANNKGNVYTIPISMDKPDDKPTGKKREDIKKTSTVNLINGEKHIADMTQEEKNTVAKALTGSSDMDAAVKEIAWKKNQGKLDGAWKVFDEIIKGNFKVNPYSVLQLNKDTVDKTMEALENKDGEKKLNAKKPTSYISAPKDMGKLNYNGEDIDIHLPRNGDKQENYDDSFSTDCEDFDVWKFIGLPIEDGDALNKGKGSKALSATSIASNLLKSLNKVTVNGYVYNNSNGKNVVVELSSPQYNLWDQSDYNIAKNELNYGMDSSSDDYIDKYISDKHQKDPVFAYAFIKDGEIYLKPNIYDDDKFYYSNPYDFKPIKDITPQIRQEFIAPYGMKKLILNALDKKGIKFSGLNDKK